ISPAEMGIVPSIEMVIWVAIGGRGTLIGAIIGAAASIAGGIIKGNKQKKAQEKAQAEAQAAQDHKDALQNAQALTSAYANQDYVDQYNDKLTLKCGGRVRRKAGFGTEFAQALPGLG
ncbi:hypothetical protein ABS246_19065, partial [Acinetobacter baumannii]